MRRSEDSHVEGIGIYIIKYNPGEVLLEARRNSQSATGGDSI